MRLQFFAMTVGLTIIVRPTIARVSFLIPVRFWGFPFGKDNTPPTITRVSFLIPVSLRESRCALRRAEGVAINKRRLSANRRTAFTT